MPQVVPINKARNGKVFDKVGVNKSTVSGTFSKQFRKKIPGAQKNGKYWASGISVVAHMKNPKIPAIHFNTRFIVTSKFWFGGGIDLTPCIKDKEEEKYFHSNLKKVCRDNKKNYNRYKEWCDKYFYETTVLVFFLLKFHDNNGYIIMHTPTPFTIWTGLQFIHS